MDNKCLIFGAGSIGKSTAGYAFSKLGFEIIFVDANKSVVDDINVRKNYRIFQTDSSPDIEIINNISAVGLDSEETILSVICDINYICTAVGMKGLDSVMHFLSKGIKARNSIGNLSPLYIIFCENNLEICSYTLNKLYGYLNQEELENVCLIDTSIERMTKSALSNEFEYDVVAEEFFPIIISKERANSNDLLIRNPTFFMPVDNLKAYYYRKLYTNNLGHAVLGYIGHSYGYSSVIQSIRDTETYETLRGALNEAGSMLITKFGFTKDNMEKHLEKLVMRYSNEGLNDTVERVIREPIRKLSRYERLIGAASLCMENNIYPASIIKTIDYAFHYINPDDMQSVELNRIIKDKGMDYVLADICDLNKNDLLYGELLKLQ